MGKYVYNSLYAFLAFLQATEFCCEHVFLEELCWSLCNDFILSKLMVIHKCLCFQLKRANHTMKGRTMKVIMHILKMLNA